MAITAILALTGAVALATVAVLARSHAAPVRSIAVPATAWRSDAGRPVTTGRYTGLGLQ